jgi:hypothetical protein
MNFVFRIPHSALHAPCRGRGRPGSLPTAHYPLHTAHYPLPTLILLALYTLTVFLAGCSAYQIGNKTLYPEGIHTVYVPMFESDSFRRYLGERLSEAVMKEIEAKTDYKVVSDQTRADSILSGRIVGETKKVLINARTGDPRELQSELRVMVSWVDARGRTIRENRLVPLPNELTDVSGAGNFIPEIGQSGATSQQEAIQRVAQQIVGLMENPW